MSTFDLNIVVIYEYSLADGIDGKQARRIGLSGPLGELFDHGLDSYSAVLIPACLYSIFGRGDSAVPPIRMYFIMWAIFLNFYISHWEKYNTGVLYLPWAYDLGMWVRHTIINFDCKLFYSKYCSSAGLRHYVLGDMVLRLWNVEIYITVWHYLRQCNGSLLTHKCDVKFASCFLQFLSVRHYICLLP